MKTTQNQEIINLYKIGEQVTDIRRACGISAYRHASPLCRQIYRDTCRELIRREDLYTSTRRMLIIYANSCATFLEAIDFLEKQGRTLPYTNEEGEERQYCHPAVTICEASAPFVSSLAKDFNIDLPEKIQSYLNEHMPNL